MKRGQALVELALTMPVLLLLATGTAAAVRVADARSGLDAATSAAAAAAARQPDAPTAQAAAQSRFADVASGYPLLQSVLHLELGGFGRGGAVQAEADALVDLSWAPFPGLPVVLPLHAAAAATIEPWRSRG